MNIEARPICGAGGLPRTQFRTGKSGLSHQPLQHSLHLERGPRALAPRSRYSLASSPAAICLNDVRLQLRYRRCDIAALADARCWRAAADFVRIFSVGLTPQLTVQLRTARLGGGDRRLRTHAEHARSPRRAVEPCRFRWLVAGTDCRYRFILNAQSSAGAGVTMVASQAGVG
jgi:hypothetical protein